MDAEANTKTDDLTERKSGSSHGYVSMQSQGVNATEDNCNSNGKTNDPVGTKTNNNDDGNGKRTNDPSRTYKNPGSSRRSNADDINSMITQFSAKTYIPKDTAQKYIPKVELPKYIMCNIANKLTYNLKSPPGNGHGSRDKATSNNKSVSNTATEAKAVFKNDDSDENHGGESRGIKLLFRLLQGYGTDEEIVIESNQEKKKTVINNDPSNNVNITASDVTTIPPGNGH